MIFRAICLTGMAWIAVLLLGCQQSPEITTEPTARVSHALGPCTLQVQGIGDPYAGWVALKSDGSYWRNRPGGNDVVNTFAEKIQELGSDVESIANVDGESLTFCAVKTDHTLWCWGANTHGQVGDGSGAPSINEPTHIAILGDNIASVGTGGEHTCAVTIDGRLFCWGSNAFGQVGDGQVNGSEDVLVPTEITSLQDQVAEVSVGFAHTCTLMKDSSVYCWGYNAYGEIGDGTSQEINMADGVKPTPVHITSLNTDVEVLSAGGFYTCIIKSSDGSLWCWGDNTEGHLATGDTENKVVPTRSAMAGPWKDVDTGVALGCGLKADGSAWCWGRDELGQLGTATPSTVLCPGMNLACAHTPQAVQGAPSGAVSISVKDHGACILMPNGDLYCWGAGNFLNGTGQAETALLVDYCDLCEPSDCAGTTPVCGSSGRCEACAGDNQCPNDTPVCLDSGKCVECSMQNTAVCRNTSTPLCDLTTNLCVACITNNDCAGTNTPICNSTTKRCRACVTDADCSGGTPACRPDGRCGECSATNLTLCQAPVSICEPTTGVCVNCVSDSDCNAAMNERCDMSTKICVTDNEEEQGNLAEEDRRYGACAGCVAASTRPGGTSLWLFIAAFALMVCRTWPGHR